MTETPFKPDGKRPFTFTALIGGGTFFISILWNNYANRYYVQITDTSNTLVCFSPMIASPDGYDINLALAAGSGTLVYRLSTNNFEAS